jgi:hypothetical protein
MLPILINILQLERLLPESQQAVKLSDGRGSPSLPTFETPWSQLREICAPVRLGERRRAQYAIKISDEKVDQLLRSMSSARSAISVTQPIAAAACMVPEKRQHRIRIRG